MVDFKPFRALRYNESNAGHLSELICPPYDVISAQEQSDLYSKTNYNSVRLELPLQPSKTPQKKYADVKLSINKWIEDNVLVRDSKESFYITRHQFVFSDTLYTRHGITGCIRLTASTKNALIRHEHTAPEPEHDRLLHVQNSHTNISPIMGLYRDNESVLAKLVNQVTEDKPVAQATLSNREQILLWKTDEPEHLKLIQSNMLDRKVHLADGHHRYGAMLQYQNMIQGSPNFSSHNEQCNFIMITLIPFNDPGLLLLPYHRMLPSLPEEIIQHIDRKIADRFEELSVIPLHNTSLKASVKTIDALLQLTTDNLIVQARKDSLMLLKPRTDMKPPSQPRNEAVITSLSWILTEQVLKPVLASRYDETLRYEHQVTPILTAINNQSIHTGFIMSPLSLNTFELLEQADKMLPPKSTFFHPKLPAGLTMRELN